MSDRFKPCPGTPIQKLFVHDDIVISCDIEACQLYSVQGKHIGETRLMRTATVFAQQK